MDFSYRGLQEFPVKNKVNLFQTGLPEYTAVRNLLNAGRRLLKVTDHDSYVYLVGEDSKVAKIEFVIPRQGVVMYLYYIPASRRLDIYDSEGLMAVFEKKRCTYTRATEAEKSLGYPEIFKTLVALT